MVGGLQTRPQLRSQWIVPAWLPFVGSAITALRGQSHRRSTFRMQ
jgi:hypothetical protein